MSFVVQSYDRTGRQLLGSDGTMLCYDLKTLKGVEGRIRRRGIAGWHRLACTLKIFSQPESRKFDDSTMRFVKTIELCKPMDAIGTFEPTFTPAQPFNIPPPTFKNDL